MHSKSKGWILIGVLLAAALTATGAAQVATTQVADTIYHADGTAATGTAIVSWPAFTTGAGDAIPSGSVSATIAAGGALSVQLVPNAGATPMGSYYTVVYHLDDGTVSRQYWVVPASAAAVKVSAVESTVMPLSVAMQTVSKSYVDTAIAAAVTGHPLDSTPYVLKAGDSMAGPLLLPADPVSAAQAADKHYVDASVAALSGGLGQSAATPPQTQYAVPAYLLSPSGGLALPGASHLSVDSTGYNLSGYHAGFTNLGVNASQADCTQAGALFGGNSCLGVTAYYNSDTLTGEWGSTINYNAYGPGQNLGNDVESGRSGLGRGGNAFGINVNQRNRHTNNANIISMYGSAVGDSGPWYVYDFDDGGVQAPSDEGTKVIGTYEGGESYGYWHGTILTGGPGATLPTFNFTGGCGDFNACTPTDGGILIDTQAAIASGYLTGPSVDVSTGVVPLKALPVSTTLPTTTAWGHAEGLSIAATVDRNVTAPQTIALTVVTGSFSPGDHVCVEGVGLPDGGFDEQSIVTSVSGSNITLPLAYPYSAVAIFKGGPCGTYISFSADLALNGYRTSYHAIASFTGSDLIYAVPSRNGLNAYIGSGLPQSGTEPETTGGTSDANAAFQTFCGAEVVQALQPNGDAVQIDPNSCAWTIGDTVESLHFPTQGVSGLWAIINQNMPNNANGTGGSLLQIGGMGFAGSGASSWGYKVQNTTSDTWYTSGGGKLAPPGCAFCSTGTWFDSLAMNEAPSDSIIRVNGHIAGQTSYYLFADDYGGSFGGDIKLDSSGFTFSRNVNCASCGFNGAGLSVNGGISTANPGSTSSITDINGSLTAATPSFTQAGQNGSRADFGSVGYGTTTPVTPLLSLITDSTYLGADGSDLVAYNSGGTQVPVLFVRSGPYMPDTNMTIENGTTHCAMLICLGPAASVDSSGNVLGASFNGVPLTGSGSASNCLTAAGTYVACSSGGGGVSGSGTVGTIPLWVTNTTTLGNSYLSQSGNNINVAACGGTNCSLDFGTNYGALNIVMYDSGAGQRYGWGLTGGTMNFVVPSTANHGGNFVFSNGGDLGVSGTNFFALNDDIGAIAAASKVYGWATGTNADTTPDTGLSRDSAGVVDVGNGTAGDSSGAIKAALYKGPATAPSGACSVVGWAFSQDGHATFCNGSTWMTKI